MEDRPDTKIGVLALQGSFREHCTLLNKLPGVTAFEVRTREQLSRCEGLVIPGGESTTMGLVAQRLNLISELKAFATAGKPMWGTCAGLILLADGAVGQKAGGQALIGGIDCMVSRNFFGAQVHSFECQLPAPPCFQDAGLDTDDFRALFIRAPAVMSSAPEVEVLGKYTLTDAERAAQGGLATVAVAVRSRNLLATAFHPELAEDLRWHQLFVHMVQKNRSTAELPSDSSAPEEAAAPDLVKSDSGRLLGRKPTRPAEMPVYSKSASYAHS